MFFDYKMTRISGHSGNHSAKVPLKWYEMCFFDHLICSALHECRSLTWLNLKLANLLSGKYTMIHQQQITKTFNGNPWAHSRTTNGTANNKQDTEASSGSEIWRTLLFRWGSKDTQSLRAILYAFLNFRLSAFGRVAPSSQDFLR